MLNLFIAIIVNAEQVQHEAENKEALAAFSQQSHGDALRRLLEDQRAGDAPSSSRSSKVVAPSPQGR